MFNKKDPLIDSVKKVMEENQIRRDAEKALNEQLGIQTRKQLPFQKHAEYDAMLAESIQEALKGAQHKIDANKNNKIDAHDFKLLRAKKETKPEEHGVEAERSMAAKGKKMYEEEKEESKEHEKKEKIDEASYSAKAARAGKDIGKPGKMFKKIASSAAKRYGSEERGKKVAGAVLAKLRSKTMKEESEESDPAPALQEKAPPGAKFERMVKHIKKKYAKDGLTKQEKSIAYATAWKTKNKEEMKEAIEAELQKNLGEKFDEIMEGMPAGGYMGQKHAASTYNDLQKDTNATDEKPSVNIKAAQGTYSQLEEEDDELDKSVKSASSLTSRSSDNNSPSGRAAGMGAETGNDESNSPNADICLFIEALSSSGFISIVAARFNLILILFLPLSDL